MATKRRKSKRVLWTVEIRLHGGWVSQAPYGQVFTEQAAASTASHRWQKNGYMARVIPHRE